MSTSQNRFPAGLKALNAVGLVVNGTLILGGSRLARAVTGRARVRRAPGIVLGTVFTGLALRLAVDGGQ